MRLPPLRVPFVGLLRAGLLVVAVVGMLTLAARGVAPTPDLVLVTVVAVALRSGPVPGAGFGLVAGWVLDLVPPGAGHPGLSALLYAAAGALAGCWRRAGPVGILWLGAVGLATAAATEGVGVLADLATSLPVDWSVVGVRVVLTAAAAAAVVPVILRLEVALHRRGLA